MSSMEDAADRVEIGALSAEFADAGMVADFDRFALLFTVDGAWRMPHVPVEFVGRSEIRAGVERMQSMWEFFVQTVHSGVIRLEGDRASGRTHISEFGRMRDGRSHANHATYYDRYERTAEGWRFSERRYEVRYVDDTDLPGSAVGPSDAR
ncbi:nuclear transport factor 2 family protein [Microbacterium sp.]|uniref:nuclear transport factor 2 family protein n=1 Tax=Microbacterium sp. TaxID=51671 RepID=UPI003A91C657